MLATFLDVPARVAVPELGRVDDAAEHVFVSPGLGTSILPVRFGIPPEISRLTLLRGAQHDVTPVPAE